MYYQSIKAAVTSIRCLLLLLCCYNYMKRPYNPINYNNPKFDSSITWCNSISRDSINRKTQFPTKFLVTEATHRSTEIMQRFRMLAVQLSTSKLTQRSHIIAPKDQLPEISQSNAIGITRRATQRSLTARLTSRQLQGLRSFLTRNTATQTRMFPITVPTMMLPSTRAINIACEQTKISCYKID